MTHIDIDADLSSFYLKASATTDAPHHASGNRRSIALSDLGIVTEHTDLSAIVASGWSSTDGFLYRQGHVVHIEGTILHTGSSALAANLAVLQVAEGFEPLVNQFIKLVDTAGVEADALVKVDTTGAMKIVSGKGGVTYAFNGGATWLDPYSGR